MPMSDLNGLRAGLADLSVLDDRKTPRKPEEPPQPASQYDGTEESGAVWVSVDPKCRLISVDVGTSWRQRLAPERFADALFSAYQSAVRKALAANFATPRRKPATRPAPPAPVGFEAGDGDFVTWLDAFLASMRERPSEPAYVRVDLDTVREVRSPSGYLTLRLRAAVLIGITGSTAGLRSANPNLLRQDLMDVFREANLTADR